MLAAFLYCRSIQKKFSCHFRRYEVQKNLAIRLPLLKTTQPTFILSKFSFACKRKESDVDEHLSLLWLDERG